MGVNVDTGEMAPAAEHQQRDRRRSSEHARDSTIEADRAEDAGAIREERQREPELVNDTGGNGSSDQASTAPSTRSEADEESAGEPAPRKWAPPEPTVDRSTVVRKAGWWQRRSES
jgi:hypothetical protein